MQNGDNDPPDHSRAAGPSHGPKEMTVHFLHLGDREKANFKVAIDRTLQSIWDQAYVEMEVTKTDRDVLQAPAKKGNPVSLMDHLSLTLAQAQQAKLCDKDFEIAAGTGGA